MAALIGNQVHCVCLLFLAVQIFSPTMSHFHMVRALVMFLVPAFLTMVSLTTPDKEDDQAWLRYWVIISLFSVLELFLDKLSFLPFYSTMKVGFVLWCLLPSPLSGTDVIFNMVTTLLLYSGVGGS